ncbi:MAG: DNA polymerase III subunit alpha, partial [Bacteroidota bacterium]
RYPAVTGAVLERLDKELNVIRLMGFSSYFLINWDLVRYARDNGYFYVGRGSGANSMAAYCLSITDVDPIDLDLYFERFINPSRTNPPDFDIDFSWKDREDITRYIFERYGTEHTALLGTYNTFQYRAVIRELGKVFGLPKTEIDRLQDHRRRDTNPDYLHRLVLRYGQLLHDLPSHLSVHAGGILISENSMHCYTATNLPPKGYPLTQFSMLEAEDIGLHKFDILSQRGLGKIKDAVEVVRQNQPSEKPIDIHDIDRFKRDDKVRKMLQRGETIGCFYVESPAMRMLLSKLEVHNYIGLVAASSIIRPGVAKSGMMREYILRHRDPSRRQYIHPIMKTLMEETYGIMVYQEDVIKVAHVFAGLTLAEADILRRGMSWKFKQRNEFSKVRDKFFTNCRKKGYPEATTAEVWRQIESFGNFAFAKGHSASYAVESYQSLFLKAHYPREYMVAVINNGGGFYRTEFYVHEARMYGATIEPPCVNNGQYLTCIWGTSLYLGFVLMRDLEERVGKLIEVERNRHGQYTSLENFTKRVNISLEQLRLLIRIGAFRFTGRTKKELLWDLHLFLGARKSTRPRRELFAVTTPNFTLPPLHYAPHEDAFDEFEILGFPLCSPFALLRDFPQDRITAQDLRRPELEGETVVITGYLVNIKNTTTSRKEQMHFGTFLDRA